MPDAANVLSALQPPHPPGPSAGALLGDLALAAAVGLCLALLVALAWPRPIRARHKQVREALDALEASRALPAGEASVVQAGILRRLVEGPGAVGVHLEGEAFAADLDRRLRTDFFTKGDGRRLTTGLYEPARGGSDAGGGTIVPELVRLVSGMRPVRR